MKIKNFQLRRHLERGFIKKEELKAGGKIQTCPEVWGIKTPSDVFPYLKEKEYKEDCKTLKLSYE